MRDLRLNGKTQIMTLYRVTSDINGVEWVQYVVANSFRQANALYDGFVGKNKKIEGLRSVNVSTEAMRGEN